MKTIEVCITPRLFDNYDIKNKVVVVVDILRATTIITTLFHNGLVKLIPVKNLEEARELKNEGYLVAAERNGKKIDFADFGNSPFEFTEEKVKGQTLVYSTTNGTNTIQTARAADSVVMASFLNISSVAECLLQKSKNVLILCSGWMQDYCAEDFLYAGALSEKLISSDKYYYNSDSVRSSIDIWFNAKSNVSDYIKRFAQYKRLVKFGFKEIVDYCFIPDITRVIPVLAEDYITKI